jgi:dipeptidyl aminopeptidase/acylaminoacyl peptidase
VSIIQYEQIDSSGAKVEMLWAKPLGSGPWPLFLFVHGHMENRVGANIHLNFLRSQIRLNRWKVCIASVSQPGYGKSDGPPDYCGPKTQQAISDTIEFFRQKSFIDDQRIALIGYSRGAICASMIATKDKSLAAVILGAGFYDFESYYKLAPLGIKQAIEREAGVDKKAFQDRSALLSAENIRSPVLILHGQRDERSGALEAEQLARRAPKAQAKIYSEFGHHIPFRVFFREVKKFLQENLNEQ